MVTSDFRPEVAIRPFRACAMKKRNITLICGRNVRVLKEIWVEKHDGDVAF